MKRKNKKRARDGRGWTDGRTDRQKRRDRVRAAEESQKKRDDGARFGVSGAGGWAQRTR